MKADAVKAGAGRHLDALTTARGIAAWWVACYHFRQLLPGPGPFWLAGILANGDLAVDFFFQLSGFIISYTYIESIGVISYKSYKAFIFRRLARIYPLHIFMLLLYVANPIAISVFSSTGDIGERYSLANFAMSVLLIQNWGFSDILSWNVPSWSISTEWFVYLAFPLIAVPFLAVFSNGRRALLGFLAAWAVLAAIWFQQGVALGGDIPRLGLLRCVIQFLMGALIQRLLAHRPEIGRALGGWAIAAGCLLMLGWVAVVSLSGLAVPDYLVVPGVWALWIYGLAAGAGIGTAMARWKTGVMVGEVSYSTYLVHFFVMDWVKFLLVDRHQNETRNFFICIAVTAILSWILFRFIEVPGRRWGRTVAGRL